jgi:ATPase family AAA domain-containing protein 3A/B
MPQEGSSLNTAGQASGDQQLTKAEKKAMEAYRFDSSALERAAEAAKTLERSSKT